MTRFFVSLLFVSAFVLAGKSVCANPLVYEGTEGLGKGKHIVFLAGDHEYRSEETLPALARILAKRHGFKCTVLFTVDGKSGEIVPGNSNMPGIEALDSADLMVVFLRFQVFPPEQMKHFVAYLDRGGPVVGLRTATHAFKFPANSPHVRFSTKYDGDDYKLGFGHQVLGQTWIGHYGRNHKQSTRFDLVESKLDHPVLRGVKDVWTECGGYWGDPVDSEVLAELQVLNGMTPDSPEDKSKKKCPVAWTRTYKTKAANRPRVFATTAGASEDLRNEGFRRMLVNGCIWAAGLEEKITPDLAVDFVGPYKPTGFRGGGHVRGVKPSDLAGWESPIMPAAKAPAKKKKTKKQDAKNKTSGKAKPPQDPELAKYGIYEKNAPAPGKAQPVKTTLPLKLEQGDRIALIGNTFFDRGQHFGWLESMIYQEHGKLEPLIRNFAWSADEVDLQPRPDNFATVPQHLTREKIDVIFASFGYNESFGGPKKLEAFKERLAKWIETTKTSAFNGESGPRIVLIAPHANEDIAGVLAAKNNNANIKLYAAAMREVGEKHGIAVVDVFEKTEALMAEEGDLTINGAHLTEEGYKEVDRLLFAEIFGESASAVKPEIREMVVDKNRQYFRRYRPLNTFYYTGGRNKSYGYLDFLPAMRNFEIMTANREKAVWELAKNRAGKVDDSNVPPLDEVIESRGANEWLSPEDERKAFRVDPRFEVNLFASEVEFPEIACPIQMRWDGQGRMWVACSTTYPHVYPGQEPNDKIVILEDTDGDGKADKSTVWADDVHIPLSFELTHDGVYVSEEPHLTLLRDTDGDGKADSREHVLTGFGTEDSHHALHDFVWTPDGDLLFRESIFHNSQVETPYGPVRAKNSAWFVFEPRHQRLTSFGNYPNTNPWGVTFDDWGHHVASHPVFASAFHATNPPYPQQHPGAAGMNAYSGVCGHEFVDFPNWPEEFHGGFVKVRYKPTNRVEYHKWVEKSDHMAEEYQFDIVFSENLSFIPVDLRYGPRGAMYVCDWYNPVKGHAQYSLRDPRRDRKSGRIWRIVPKGMKPQDPPKIAGASVPELLDNLKRPEYRYRYWTKRELRAEEPETVAAALDSWVAALDKNDPRFRHHQVEAMWAYRNIGENRPELLKELLKCESRQARAAATRQLRYWQDVPALAERAKDANGIVRLEAVIAASYIGTKEALEAVLPAMDLPMDAHLNYAIRTSLGSEALMRHWTGGPHEKKVADFVKGPRKVDAAKIAGMPRNSNDADFNSQKGVQTVEVSCVPERIMYTNTKFRVKAGRPVKLVFTNPDATAHNLVIVKPGAAEEVGMAGNEMAKDPGGFKKGFVPESDKILWHTRLIGPGEADVLRFKAPEKKGTYPYVCTFPGHWVIMKGEMVVE